MSERWHYGIDGTRRPPVEREELLNLLRSGIIHPHRDKVWTQGMETWTSPADVPDLDWAGDRPRPDWRPMSWDLWAGFQASYLAFNLLFILMARRSVAAGAMPSDTANLVNTLALACLLGATSMAGLAGWRNWELIQGHGARTTPLKAIALLFLPFFNLYWIWIAVPGLAADYNRFADRQSDQPPRHELRYFQNLAIAMSVKYFMVFVSALSLIPKIMPRDGGSIPTLGTMSPLEILELQLAAANWGLIGTFVFGLALFPVMRDVFGAVNHYAESPEES